MEIVGLDLEICRVMEIVWILKSVVDRVDLEICRVMEIVGS